jgi:hypothetical protein
MKKLIPLIFLLSVSLHGQILWDQPDTPLAVAQGYGYKLYVTPSGGSTPASVISLVSVTCSASASANVACTAPIQQAAAVGATKGGAKSELTAVDVAGGFAESPKSAPFVMQVTCAPNAVKVVVGSWTRSVVSGGVGQVLFSLQQSANPVNRVAVLFNGILQDELTGTKLNNVAGTYFRAGVPKGTYQLTVEAFDVDGCHDGGASRPMTVTVT